jgi:hypothetical protein
MSWVNVANSTEHPVNCRILDVNGNPYSPTSTLPTTVYDESGNPITITRGNLNVLAGDQITPPLDSLFAQSISNFTISAPTVASGVDAGDLEYTFEATAGHGIVATDEILLLDTAADKSFYAEVLNVAVNTITVDRPIDHLFPTATTLGRIVTTEMAVDGSVTPQIFSLRAGAVPVDSVRFLITMTDDTSMDDSRFGGIAALTRGLVLRIVNSFQKTIFCFKSNQEIKQFCYDVSYSDRAPAGSFGLVARISFGGQSKHGVVLRISDDDVIQWVVQDDLTELTSLKVSVQGHETEE